MVSKNRIPLRSKQLLVLLGFAVHCGMVQAAASARWMPPERAPRPGEPVEIVCRAEWALGDTAPNVLPAESPSLDWGSLELLRTESGFDGDAAFVDQVFSLTVAAPGTFRIPSLDIPYLDGGGTESENVPTINAPSLVIEIREFNRALYTAVAAAGVTAVLAAFLIGLRLRKTRAQSQTQTDQLKPNQDEARAALNRARRLRIDGDFYGCYQAMVEAVSSIGSPQDSLAADLAARAQAAGYGGSRPDDTLLDSDFRAVERAINQADADEVSDIKTTVNQNEVAKT